MPRLAIPDRSFILETYQAFVRLEREYLCGNLEISLVALRVEQCFCCDRHCVVLDCQIVGSSQADVNNAGRFAVEIVLDFISGSVFGRREGKCGSQSRSYCPFFFFLNRIFRIGES